MGYIVMARLYGHGLHGHGMAYVVTAYKVVPYALPQLCGAGRRRHVWSGVTASAALLFLEDGGSLLDIYILKRYRPISVQASATLGML